MGRLEGGSILKVRFQVLKILALVAIAIQLSFAGLVLSGLLTGWDWSQAGVQAVLAQLLHVVHSDWFGASILSGAIRAAVIAFVAASWALIAFTPALSGAFTSYLKPLLVWGGILPLLFNFTVSCLIWKFLLLDRSIENVAWTGLSTTPQLALFASYLGQHIPIAIVMLFGPATRLTMNNSFDFLRTLSPSRMYAFVQIGLPLIFPRLLALVLLSFVLVFTDAVAVDVLAGGKAASVSTFVAERFRQNSQATAAAASLVGGALVAGIVAILATVRFVQPEDAS